MVLLCCPLHIKSNTKVGLMLETRRECRLLAFSAHRGCAHPPMTETGTLLYKHTIHVLFGVLAYETRMHLACVAETPC